ncbi:hypothetical protein P691DRAFT_806548 [Macrolepiota fuliginosa MF-IS2]|uniref:Mg2+ transporter protein, CorA-like/Zinc transport protein ZntB n=1 Tax=Macrolepiota fuliginosa MF-IS2 TaxID=1400762 RepID=A0A9P5X7R6_9AGAR|nr:hypothetical protein P691DRAFT_806548 [Macrolepiota fuliginosa MF-IS2]
MNRPNPTDQFTPTGDPTRVPNPPHRHAAPSAPWPWVDLSDEVDPGQLTSELPPVPELCDHEKCGDTCWRNYPISRFPNWTRSQVNKSKILKVVEEYNRDKECKLYYVDVDDRGRFTSAEETVITENEIQWGWQFFVENKRRPNLRVRALFIENLSGPVLQMLGAKFNIEPFFWSSSLNWIPSRYQEDPQPGKGDHITICLTFLRSMPQGTEAIRMDASGVRKSSDSVASARPSILSQMMIDTQAPLPLKSSDQLLVLDLLSVHLIRNTEGSTIISYHPSLPLPTTTAHTLQERIRFAGQSVYWQKMFQKSSDPTFVLLTFLWHAMYAWDEALENLYIHICTLETKVIETNEMRLTSELHVIRAHQLHYSSLLGDFRKTVQFILDTPNPALNECERGSTQSMLERECKKLLAEIERLDKSRKMQDKRLKNVMNLVFSSVNIKDSRRMQEMTEAAVRDSAAMKQVAYLTMIFLPSSFVAAVFGMNVREINPTSFGTLPHYAGAAIAMTAATIWIIIAFQSQHLLPNNFTFLMRLGWPVLLILKWLGWIKLDADDDPNRPLQAISSHGGGAANVGVGHIHNHDHGDKVGLPTIRDDMMELRST